LTTFDELHQIITQGENVRVEFKVEASEEVIRGLSTDLAAMANTQGGVIIFGVTNAKDPRGLLLKGDERERISQSASNCTPPITVDFEEVRFGARAFLLVQIPRSIIIHNDPNRKFPTRIGNTTGYFDSLGLVALLQEKRLLQYEVPQPTNQVTTVERKREQLSQSETQIIVRGLNAQESSVRLEAIRDLITSPFYVMILEDKSIIAAIDKILKARNPEEIGPILQVIRVVQAYGTETERENARAWNRLIFDIGKTIVRPEIASTAFQILADLPGPEALQLMLFWVNETDDPTFTSIHPDNMLMNPGLKGLRPHLREEMYQILLSNANEKAKKRASLILQSLRQMGW
jgi:hypothetical protein